MNVIFKTLVGSKLYNLHTDSSDTDIKGIFQPPLENIVPSIETTLGIKPFTKMERVETVTGDGKDKVESTFYSAKYFTEMMIKSNPTVVEMIFADKEYIEATDSGLELIKFIRENLVTQHIYISYTGYFKDQIRGFQKKTGKCREKRQELIDKFGYDSKMASNSYRIGIQGIELFSTGSFNPTMSGPSRQLAFDIKLGKVSREDFLDILTETNKKLENSITNSPLPLKPDIEKTHNFILDFNRKYYGL
jgi:hypothetical protein